MPPLQVMNQVINNSKAIQSLLVLGNHKTVTPTFFSRAAMGWLERMIWLNLYG